MLESSDQALAKALRATRRPIGDLLLEETLTLPSAAPLAQALFDSGLDPRIPGDALDPREALRLARALEGLKDSKPELDAVSQQAVLALPMQACTRCGTLIERLQQESSCAWCPRCQGGRSSVQFERKGQLFRGFALWGHPTWAGRLFPPGTAAAMRLAHYAQRVTAVEGNTVFYGLPDKATVERWASAMPAGFRFLCKLPKDMTHAGLLCPQIERIPVLLERLAPLGSNLGPIFAQLPTHYGPERFDDLAAFLHAWPHDRQALCLEVRHADWFRGAPRERLVQLLCAAGTGRVVLDTRAVHGRDHDPAESAACSKPLLPLDLATTAAWSFVRFIGSADSARNRPLLIEWAARVDRLLRSGRDVYWFAHCPNEDRSPEVLLDFEQQLALREGPAPALPWDGSPARAPQGELFE